MNGHEVTVPARRLTLSAIVEQQLAALSKTTATSSSVSIVRNARGAVQLDVNVSAADDEQTVLEAARVARLVFDELDKAYPLPAAPAAEGAAS